MKKFLSVLMVALAVGVTVVPMHAEAKRIGSSRSIGMQRQSTPPPSAPKQAQTGVTSPAAGAAAGTAAAASSRSRWLGPIAGIAAGLGLAALASHLGMGEAFGSFLLIMLLAAAGFALFRMFTRQRASNTGGLAYAGQGAGDLGQGQSSAYQQQQSYREPVAATGAGSSGGFQGIGAGVSPFASTSPKLPDGFDAAGFERQAKVNFIRLQAANDAGDLADLRAFTSPEMYAEIEMDIRDRKGAQQKTEVLDLNASVFEVVEENHLYVASVRFTGAIREDGVEANVDEVWHLIKPTQGSGGWVLAGIQQLS